MMFNDINSEHMSTMGGGGAANRGDINYNMISKNPSTAAGTYVQGFGGGPGGYGIQKSAGKYPNESFDLDIMMPPDITSIDSDISKFQ
jgi:hypothetical protein